MAGSNFRVIFEQLNSAYYEKTEYKFYGTACGGEEYERQKEGLNDKLREQIEGTKEKDAQVNREWDAIGWTVVRYWEEELKD